MSAHLHSDCADWAERPCSGDPCRHGQTACPVASACQNPDDEDQSESATMEVLRVYAILGAVIAGALVALHLALTAWPA
jgi:hypothetical protein